MQNMKMIDCSSDHRFFTSIIIVLMMSTIFKSIESLCGDHESYVEYIWDESTLNDKPKDTTLFQQNLQSALNNLPSEESINMYRFSSSNSGEGPNAAYASAFCIGDSGYNDCLSCIQNATSYIKEDCSNITSTAIIWYGSGCVARYSNHPIKGILSMADDMVQVRGCNIDKATTQLYADKFDGVRTDLFYRLAIEAASRTNGFTMNSMGEIYDGLNNQTIFAATHCTPDLYPQQCRDCLSIIGKKLDESCSGKEGGSVIGPNCNFRYEIYPFINENSFYAYSFLESSSLSQIELDYSSPSPKPNSPLPSPDTSESPPPPQPLPPVDSQPPPPVDSQPQPPFYSPPPPTPAPSRSRVVPISPKPSPTGPIPTTSGGSNKNIKITVGVTVTAGGVSGLSGLLAWCLCKRKKLRKHKQENEG